MRDSARRRASWWNPRSVRWRRTVPPWAADVSDQAGFDKTNVLISSAVWTCCPLRYQPLIRRRSNCNRHDAPLCHGLPTCPMDCQCDFGGWQSMRASQSIAVESVPSAACHGLPMDWPFLSSIRMSGRWHNPEWRDLSHRMETVRRHALTAFEGRRLIVGRFWIDESGSILSDRWLPNQIKFLRFSRSAHFRGQGHWSSDKPMGKW